MAERSRIINFEFPVRGKVTSTAYRNQPGGTTPDCLNVIPWSIDASGRQVRGRGGQRWGISKLFPTDAAIGSGTDIQLIRQATIPLDPSTVLPTTLLLDETFDYATGYLSAVAASKWIVKIVDTSGGNAINYQGLIDYGSAPLGGLVARDIEVDASHHAVLSTAFSYGNRAAARWIGTSPVLGSSYVLRVAYKATANDIALFARWNPDHVTAEQRGVVAILDISAATVSLRTPGTTIQSTTLPPGTFNATTEKVFELRVNGDSMQVLVDGTAYLSAMGVTAGAGNTGVGFGTGISKSTGAYVDQFQAWTASSPLSLRQTNLVAVESGGIYQGLIGKQPALVSGGAAQLRQGRKPAMAQFRSKGYFVDGSDNPPRVLDMATKAMEAWTNTAGTVPQKCSLATIWRGRLILGREEGAEQNFYMSKVGDPHGWDYNEQTSARAVAANASATFGRLGDPLVAMAAWTDDQLVLFCDHSIHVLSGDPAAGGQLDLISGQTGCVGPKAWCHAPDGSLFFIGAGGLYLMAAGGRPVPISLNSSNDYFAGIDRGAEWVMLAYDNESHQIHCYRTLVDSGKFVDHMIFDVRTKGFFPVRYKSQTIGPASVCQFDGDAPNDRAILYGGRNGRLYKADPKALNDDGLPIYSYAVCGPIRLMDDLSTGEVHALDVITGHDDPDLTYGLNWILKLGSDHQQVSDAKPATSPVEIAGVADARGHNSKSRIRGRGGSCSLVCWNNAVGETWALERAVMEVAPGGRQR